MTVTGEKLARMHHRGRAALRGCVNRTSCAGASAPEGSRLLSFLLRRPENRELRTL